MLAATAGFTAIRMKPWTSIHANARYQVVSAATCSRVLAVMATAGLYERSGSWLYDVGPPGKSGVSGGMLTIAPGKGAVTTFSPPLDSAGNSVRGQLVMRFLSEHLGLNLFSSEPTGGSA
nr:glutaminase [uncultured Cupriavidus sp.]